MTIHYASLKKKILKITPLFMLYFFSFTDFDADFINYLEFFYFNLQLIVIYYWVLKNPSILGYGHVFFAGIINDVVIGLPLGTTSLGYLVLSFVASYIREHSLRSRLISDWFAFLPAIFFSNLIYLVLIIKFSNFEISYTELVQNSFFTFLFFPIFYQLFYVIEKNADIKIDA
jgi:rod shape-determining protein MreD